MGQLTAAQTSAGSAFPVGYVPAPGPGGVIPPIEPPDPVDFYAGFGALWGDIVDVIKTGQVRLRRYYDQRDRPFRKSIVNSYQDYELVAYVSGPQHFRRGSLVGTKFTVTFSAARLSIVPSINDTYVIDGTEYPLLDGDDCFSRIPKAGTSIIAWRVKVGLLPESPG